MKNRVIRIIQHPAVAEVAVANRSLSDSFQVFPESSMAGDELCQLVSEFSMLSVIPFADIRDESSDPGSSSCRLGSRPALLPLLKAFFFEITRLRCSVLSDISSNAELDFPWDESAYDENACSVSRLIRSTYPDGVDSLSFVE